jgi:SAM-dependent methyltransferase
MSHRLVTSCRVCGSGALAPVLDLGEQPLANGFLEKEALTAREPKYPLALLRCGTCALGSLSVVVPPADMFSHYLYVTGASSTMREHFVKEATMIRDRFLRSDDLAIEIGSNDGTLLAALVGTHRVLGVEPSANIGQIARDRGVPTECAFFGEAVAAGLARTYGRAAVVIANNVIAHIDDLDSVMRGVDALLDDNGVFVVEAPGLLDLLERCAFDTIYHEHLSYLSVTALARLADGYGFAVFDVEHLDVHLGSLRVFMDRRRRSPTPAVAQSLAHEEESGLLTAGPYARFADQARTAILELNALLDDEHVRGRRVAGYGAAAKGSTLLCAAGITAERLAYVVDKNPLKHGLFTPGTHIEVSGVERLDEDRPDTVLILAWNLADEVRAQLRSFEERGGRFVVPLPAPRYL